MDAAVAARSLDWMLRRLKGQRLVATDLVVVRDRPELLAHAPAHFDHAGVPWRFARVEGPLGLRDALPDQDRVVIAVPDGLRLPTDVLGRCHLHRAIELRAQDAVAALANRHCATLDDPALDAAVWELLPELQQRAGRWTMGPAVGSADVRAMVLSVLLQSEGRIDRDDPGELLGRWLAAPPRPLRAAGILRQALEEAHGVAGCWLGEALVGGWLPLLVAGGALAHTPTGRAALPTSVEATLQALGRRHGDAAAAAALTRLATGAAGWLVARRPDVLGEALAPAEAAWQRLREPGAGYPLVRGALLVELHDCARDAALGKPPDDAVVLRLERNVWVETVRPDLDCVRDLSRLMRFVLAVPADVSRTAEQWAMLGLRDTAWADRTARDLRRRLPTVGADLRRWGDQVLDRYLAARDALNARFAEVVRDGWTAMAGTRQASDPVLALNRLSRDLLAPLLRGVDRVFLVVLDGCDTSTFVELAAGLPDDLGLALPPLRAGDTFADGLLGQPALRAAWSPPPTVTVHSRRALFAGEIPGNQALDDRELSAADATSDHRAFESNPALVGVAKRLFLKGELHDQGAALCGVLTQAELRLVAAVFNGVDDALSSHETTALGPWRPEGLGAGFVDALRAAVDHGWTVVVTSDHGHTPHWGPERKLDGPADGQRFRRTADQDGLPGVVLTGAAVAGGPYLCLHRVGAWFGQQRRGYHGGVGLEEVVVPLAFLGRVRPGSGRPAPPSWWTVAEGVAEDDSRVLCLMTARVPAPTEDPLARYLSAVAGVARGGELVAGLARHQRLGVGQVAALTGILATRVPGFVGKLNTAFRGQGLGEPLVVEGEGSEATVQWLGPRHAG